jgi:hypothetical protein
LETIGDSAFSAVAIEHISFPESLMRIGIEAFQDCNGLTLVLFLKNPRLQNIEDRAFSTSAIRSVVLPNGIAKIGNEAFPRQCKVELHEEDNRGELIAWLRDSTRAKRRSSRNSPFEALSNSPQNTID